MKKVVFEKALSMGYGLRPLAERLGVQARFP
jgi:hypothetical protein